VVKHYNNLAELFFDFGKPAPEHPLFAVVSVDTDTTNQVANCSDFLQMSTTDFYSISLKHVIEGEVLYGKTQYDCRNGTMVFMSPNQLFGAKGVKVKTEGHMILFHPDFLAGHPLSDSIKKSTFFDYSVNEALHLSPREEMMMIRLINYIGLESESGYDKFSREIILSHISTLLSYGERFYQRQFVQRLEIQGSLEKKLEEHLEAYYAKGDYITLPSLRDIAERMKLSSRYLSDGVKAETGKSAKEYIQLFIVRKAKSMLVNTDEAVATIGYGLGFEYPQYFVRLFKKKTGMTPTDFRQQFQ
jgi:AraC-like DNA-binding protein